MSTYVRRFLVFIFNDQPTIGWNVLRRAIYIPVIFYISYLVGTKQRKLFESGRHDYRTPQCLGGIRYHPSTFPTRPKCSLDVVELNKIAIEDTKLAELSNLLYLHLKTIHATHPQIENDAIITDSNSLLFSEKYLEELRHQIALKLVEKNVYNDTLEPKLAKRDRLIRESNYPYKHVLYKLS